MLIKWINLFVVLGTLVMSQQVSSQSTNFIKEDSDTIITLANTTNGQTVGERNEFWTWVAGIAGFTTTEKPVVLDPPERCEPCSCGIINKKNRIVGGHETEVNQYPWMAMLMYGTKFYCGATLINDRYVLTAAHCVHGFDKNRISVRLLEHDRNIASETQTITKKVLRIVRHARYNPSTYDNDIALLRLDSPVELKSPLRSACLPTKGKSYTGFDGVVTGWGAVQEQGDTSVTLQEVTVPILSNIDCRKRGYGQTRITDNMMCAGYEEGKRDSCQGDSGGPLHVLNKESGFYQVVGVVSWGEGCAQKNYPGVYSRVNRYISWITSNTIDACYC